MKNPPWSRDELILALELYFREPAARGNKTHKEVYSLSDILNSLPVHVDRPKETFRNASGVGMKLSNFLRFDPEYTGKGLGSGSKLDEEVWNEFAHDLSKLNVTAKAIKENYSELRSSPPSIEDDEPEEEASEGRVLTRVHRLRERNQSIVNKKKKSVLDEKGKLACEVCSFDFEEHYGQLGYGFAECHHEIPVSELKPSQKTKIGDLRILCSNCHRMIHRAKPWLSVEQLKSLKENNA